MLYTEPLYLYVTLFTSSLTDLVTMMYIYKTMRRGISFVFTSSNIREL